MRAERFIDDWRGNGWYVAGRKWLIAFRPLNWHLGIVRPPGKPGYLRGYVGPFEFEWRS